jgi:universal stress protein E
MMQQHKKLLAVIDPTQEHQRGLARAIELAEKTQSSITALLVIFDLSYEVTTILSSAERDDMRAAYVDNATEWLSNIVLLHNMEQQCDIDIKVVWHKRPFEAILHESIHTHYDMVVKATHKHDKLQSFIFTPTDWHLMRKSHIPVLMVKEHPWPEDGNIVAAINAGATDAEHVNLNDNVCRTAKNFTQLLNGRSHLVNAFPRPPLNIAIEIPEFDPADYTETLKKNHQCALEAMAKRYHIPNEMCHAEEGHVEDVLPQITETLDAELLVIGNIGREGLSAAFVGNTAEHIIDQVDCDVLSLRTDCAATGLTAVPLA